MTEAMKKTLIRSTSNMGVAGSSQTFEAQKNGWVEYYGTPQNSTVHFYKITELGKAALESAA